MAPARAAIIGLAGPRLTSGEAALWRRCPPLGAILFARNIQNPDQLRALTDDIRAVLGAAAPILIDQEGGRVARLKPPHWSAFPAAARFENQPEIAERANALMLGAMCRDMGLDVVCAPVLDLRLPGAHQVIGDRAFSAEPAEIARLGVACIAGLQAAGCIPVIKHIPGHGRAGADSHLALPRVDSSAAELSAVDFVTFRSLDSCPMAMTAHVVYDSIDPQRPATTSPKVVRDVIRGEIGFDGLLMSDDLSMKALDGPLDVRARAALFAGCDVVLHCNGDMEEMKDVASQAGTLEGASLRRAEHALSLLQPPRLPFDLAVAEARVNALLECAA